MAMADSPKVKEILFEFLSEEGAQKALLFQPRPSDVIIVTPPKCGTTWMQQITHQLRTGGDMDFYGIREVVPWIEMAHDWKYDLEAEQRAEPRLFKSHLPYNNCPKGCRYIVVYRNPCSSAYSFYKFLQGKLGIPADTLTVEELITTLLSFDDVVNPANPLKISYYTHLLSWNDYRNDPNVLVLFFEEMKEDLDTVVRAVASFLGIHDEEKIRVAVERSTFEFMKANDRIFNGKPMGLVNPQKMQLIRTGSADEALKVLSEDMKARIQEGWEKTITKVTGYKTYEELRRGFRAERPFAK